jgi:hypothetical protein
VSDLLIADAFEDHCLSVIVIAVVINNPSHPGSLISHICESFHYLGHQRLRLHMGMVDVSENLEQNRSLRISVMHMR